MTSTTIIRKVREKGKTGWREGELTQVTIFGYMLTIALLTIALFSPGIAKALAMLGLVGAFALNGPAVFGWLGDLGR